MFQMTDGSEKRVSIEHGERGENFSERDGRTGVMPRNWDKKNRRRDKGMQSTLARH